MLKPNTGTAPQPRSNLSGMCPVRTPPPPPFSPHPNENKGVRGKTPRSTPRNKGLTCSRVPASLQNTKHFERKHSDCIPKPQPGTELDLRTPTLAFALAPEGIWPSTDE